MAVKMVVDCSNLLFRVASMVEKRHDEPGGHFDTEEQKGAFALHLGLNSLLKYYRKFKPHEIALAFEGRNNWRKSYTAERTEGVRQYKANRVLSDRSQSFFELIDSFKTLVREHTSMICLAVDGLEGDDVIAGYVQETAQVTEDKIVIVSGDKDFMQLGKYKNVMLIDPASGKDRITAELNFDPDFFMFEKCMRGDAGDNVMSAFPRVRKVRLEKAFNDDYEFTQLMEETWTSPKIDSEGNPILDDAGVQVLVTNRVGDIFAHNRILMDLEAQPAYVKEKIIEGIAKARADVGKYNHFHFMRFLGKHQLTAIADQAHIYTEMFSTRATKNQISGSAPEVHRIDKSGALKASEYLNKAQKESSLLEF